MWVGTLQRINIILSSLQYLRIFFFLAEPEQRILYLHFSIDDLYDFESFYKIGLAKVSDDTTYNLFIKVMYLRINQETKKEYFMAGHQLTFRAVKGLTENHKEIIGLHGDCRDRLKDYLRDYQLTNKEIGYVQVAFRAKDEKLLSEFTLTNPLPACAACGNWPTGRLAKPKDLVGGAMRTAALGIASAPEGEVGPEVKANVSRDISFVGGNLNVPISIAPTL